MDTADDSPHREAPGRRTVPLHRVSLTGHEQAYAARAVAGGQVAGDGPFTHARERRLETHPAAPDPERVIESVHASFGSRGAP